MFKCKSTYFEVNEGARQGGVLSDFLYLIFINELINELANCNEVTGVNSIKCCAPSLADDITCISTTPRGLQRMLDICTYYANKWRFQFSGMKFCVIQFSKSSFKPDFDWTINQESIPVADSHTHLGIELGGKLSAFSRTTNACRNGRNIYFTITNIRDDNTSPLGLVKLYKSVVIPSVLYRCEVWNNLKNKDLLLLNKLQHFVAKHAHKFSTLK